MPDSPEIDQEGQTAIAGFIVDTHLLRELGDLLVGRDSTAVLELIKNSYDADAREVVLTARNLDDPTRAEIVVSDDGNGMNAATFQQAFLRIAGRSKEEGKRQSPVFKRAYTGQKGIGRLASQKLARRLTVDSVPAGSPEDPNPDAVHAVIDWDVIDQQDRLDQLSRGLDVVSIDRPAGRASGTRLALSSLKRKWRSAEMATFVSEVQGSQPAPYVIRSGDDLGLACEPLFGTPILRHTSEEDPGFKLSLEGDFAPGDDLWSVASSEFEWCVEIDVRGGTATYKISPTRVHKAKVPIARDYSFTTSSLPNLTFQARFYIFRGASARRGPLRGFTLAHAGIRVYYEGFRVLPYGEYGDDWLEIDREYRGGARFYKIDAEVLDGATLEMEKTEGLFALASNAYYGAVFLTDGGAPGLESLVNREGFVPGDTFAEIRRVTKTGVQLSVRVRRSLETQLKALEAAAAEAPADDNKNVTTDGEPSPPASNFDRPPANGPKSEYAPMTSGAHPRDAEAAVNRAASKLADLEVSEGNPAFGEAQQAMQSAKASLAILTTLQAELRILAGVGLQLGAFVHDINGMLGSIRSIRSLLRALEASEPVPHRRRELSTTLAAADSLAHVLARQSSYLTDVLSLDPRRRRSRIRLRDSVDSVLSFLEPRVEDRGLTVRVSVSDSVKTAPMFPAELSILLTNLLTNAVKNAAHGGTIWIDAQSLPDRATAIWITNDGTSVDPAEGERWFLPFESTTTDVDEVLGQGLGLGLPIVRAIASDYDGDVTFTDVRHDASTTVQVILRDRSK